MLDYVECEVLLQVYSDPEFSHLIASYIFGGARGVMVSVVGNGHGNTSSNPGRD